MAERKGGEQGPGGGSGGCVGAVWGVVEGFMEENRSCPMREDE